jgi:hypothetical protein
MMQIYILPVIDGAYHHLKELEEDEDDWTIFGMTIFEENSSWFDTFDMYYFWVYYLSLGLFTMVIVTQIIAKCSNPGKLIKDESLDFMELLEKIEFDDLCAHCKLIKTPRSKHCLTCN